MKKEIICKGFRDKAGICKNKAENPKKNPFCKNCAGKSFENHISKFFKIQGYEVYENLKSASTQNDFYAVLKYGITNIGVLVECKWKFDEKSTVNGQDVRKLSGSWQSFNRNNKYGKAEKAFLITNAKFAPEAIEVAKDTDIELFTEGQLVRNLMNFEPYLKELVHNYDNSHLADHFIELNCTSGLSLSEEVEDFLSSNEEGLVILGDYGTGKTSFSTKLSSDLARRILSGEDLPIPILVFLREYEKAFNMEELITNMLINKLKIHNGNFNTFLEMLKYGNIILIFDGFDEIARRVDYTIKYKVISEISRFASPNTKVIVTARPNFFNQREEFERIFKSSPLYYEPNRKNIVFNELEIDDLEMEQISDYILSYEDKLKEQGFEINEFMDILKNIHDLSDLAKRPVLLNVIIETVPILILEEGTKINAAKLYHRYTSFWLDREDQKGKTLIKAIDKTLFANQLAWKMFNHNTLLINHKDIPIEIKNYFNINSKDDIDYFSHDIKSCSFLNYDESYDYKFIHKSFMEYFAAYHILYELHNYSLSPKNKQKKVDDLLGHSLITLEVGFFIKDLLDIKIFHEQDLERLFKMIDINKLNAVTRKNVLSIMAKMGIDLLPILSSIDDLRDMDLSYAILKNGALKNKDLFSVSFYGAKIDNVDFSKSKLTNSIFRSSKINKSSFRMVDLEATDFSKSVIKDCNLSASILAFSNFNDAKIINSNFDSTELTEIGHNNNTVFQNCKNLEKTIGIPYNINIF